jgi:hypothetical protein
MSGAVCMAWHPPESGAAVIWPVRHDGGIGIQIQEGWPKIKRERTSGQASRKSKIDKEHI